MKQITKFKNFIFSSKIQGKQGFFFFYAVSTFLFFVFKLCFAFFMLVCFLTGKYTPQSLTLNDFEQVGVEQIDDMTMINATSDTQLLLSQNISSLYITYNFSQDPGEFLAYYSYQNNGVFNPNHSVYARLIDGQYIFEFPIGVRQIRIDTGIFPSITVSFENIFINPFNLQNILRFSASDLFYLLVVPAVLYSIWDCFLYFAKRKKLSFAPVPS